MDKHIRKENDKKIEQNVKVLSCKIIGLILIATLLLSTGLIEVVNAQTPSFQLFNDKTLKIWNDATKSTKNWAYGISEALKYVGITKNDFDRSNPNPSKWENIRTENPKSSISSERSPHVNINFGGKNYHMTIDTSGNVKLDGSTEPKTINVNNKKVTFTPNRDKLKIECNGKSVNVYANDAGYINVDEKGNVRMGRVETGGDGKGGSKLRDNSPKKGGSPDKKPPAGKGKSSTAKPKVSVQKVINGFGAKVGSQLGGINFTEIHGGVEGDYLNLRFASVNENEGILFLSELIEQSEEDLVEPPPYTSLELLLTSMITPDESFWIDLIGFNKTGRFGSVDMDFERLGNTSQVGFYLMQTCH